MSKYTDKEIIKYTLSWVEKFIIGHNICPFAKYSMAKKDFVIDVCHNKSPRKITKNIYSFFDPIAHDSNITNAFLILPRLHSFEALLDIKSIADDFFENIGWHHIAQLVVFHPEFRFADEDKDSKGNYVNRSPFPMLHFLKESAVEHAVKHYDDIEDIPKNNKRKLNKMEKQELKSLLKKQQL